MADHQALVDFYGSRFRPDVIPQWPDIEKVPKTDILNTLIRATGGTRKGSYHKGRHSFEVLGRLDPIKVADASSYARRLINSLKKLSA